VIPADPDLDALLKRLHLANARRVWRDLCARAEKGEWAYQHLLDVLFAEEVAHRQQTRLQKASRDAGFPFLKTVDDFNFTYQSTVRLPLIGSYLSADFVTEGRSLILHGRPGRGKTHLAVAIAYRAIQNGFDALFVTAAALIEELSVASRQGRLREVVAEYTHPHVLVVDEVGYLAYGDDAANVLFHVVNERHLKRRSMIFTTNKPLDAWGQVLHDKDLAAAIVDRILERGRLLRLDGPSLRTKHLGLDDATEEASTQPARISGIRRQEFPEPTIRVCGMVTENSIRQKRLELRCVRQVRSARLPAPRNRARRSAPRPSAGQPLPFRCMATPRRLAQSRGQNRAGWSCSPRWADSTIDTNEWQRDERMRDRERRE
jgi:DNA replication protein DnaC